MWLEMLTIAWSDTVVISSLLLSICHLFFQLLLKVFILISHVRKASFLYIDITYFTCNHNEKRGPLHHLSSICVLLTLVTLATSLLYVSWYHSLLLAFDFLANHQVSKHFPKSCKLRSPLVSSQGILNCLIKNVGQLDKSVADTSTNPISLRSNNLVKYESLSCGPNMKISILTNCLHVG